MADARPHLAAAATGRGPGLALVFAVAAAAACWNPFAAPLGLVVGAAATALAVAALRRRRGRVAIGIAALVVGLGAAVTGGAVLLYTAGAITTELPGEPVVRGRSDAEAAALLEEAARRTASTRARARSELEKGTGPQPTAPTPSGAPSGTANDGAGLQPALPAERAGDEDETE